MNNDLTPRLSAEKIAEIRQTPWVAALLEKWEKQLTSAQVSHLIDELAKRDISPYSEEHGAVENLGSALHTGGILSPEQAKLIASDTGLLTVYYEASMVTEEQVREISASYRRGERKAYEPLFFGKPVSEYTDEEWDAVCKERLELSMSMRDDAVSKLAAAGLL